MALHNHRKVLDGLEKLSSLKVFSSLVLKPHCPLKPKTWTFIFYYLYQHTLCIPRSKRGTGIQLCTGSAPLDHVVVALTNQKKPRCFAGEP